MTPDQAVPALLPCPFCGVQLAENNNYGDLHVRRYGTHYQHTATGRCFLDDAEVPPSDFAAWNRRATPAPQQTEQPGSGHAGPSLAQGTNAAERKSALDQYLECGGTDECSPLERLRFFCSLAMNGRDWLDVESFFDAVASAPHQGEPVRMLTNREVEILREIRVNMKFDGLNEDWQREARHLLLKLEQHYAAINAGRTIPEQGEKM